MIDRDMLSALLIVLAIADWIITVVLLTAARDMHEGALSERAQVSVILSTAATIVAILAGLSLARVTIPSPWGYLALTAVVIGISVPQLVWAVSLYLGRFR